MTQDYNYDSFSTDKYDFPGSVELEAGKKAPNFCLETADGQKKWLLEFNAEFLVLELGSITCPLFHARRNKMQQLEEEFSQVDFAVLYVREAHPGLKIPSHKSYNDKKSCAMRLKTEDADNRTIFVDDLDGTAHQAYGNLPNSLFIIDKEGIVRFKAEWNNPSSTQMALRQLIRGEDAKNIKSYFLPASPQIVLKTASRGGKGSGSDFFRALPLLIWNNIRLNLRTLLKVMR